MSATTETLDLLLIGDVCLPLAEEDPAPFAALKAQTTAGTVLVANVEGALTACDRPVAGRYAIFRDSPVALAQLEGIDVALLANNHVGDFGVDGGADTVRHLVAAGIAPVGYGRLHAEGTRVCRLTRAGVTVVFVNACCPTTNPPAFATVESTGAAPLCPAVLKATIHEARETADAVVFCPHWGLEMQALPAPEQVAMAHWAIEAGADAVVGHHAHVIQSVETYRGAPIFYGLGNAWFPGTGWLTSDQAGRSLHKPYRISERERLSLAVTLRVRPAHAGGRRLAVAAVQRLRFEAPGPPRVLDTLLSAADAAPVVPPLRRLLAAQLVRRLRRGGTLDFRAAMRDGRLCYWYASQQGRVGMALRCEAALFANPRKARAR